MDNIKNKWVEVQGYKHDGSIHRIWDSLFVLDENEDYVVAISKKVKVLEHNFRVWYTKEPAIMIYFKKRWFNVVAMLKKNGIVYYVNLASPYLFDDKKIKYIDYDLDLKLYPNNLIKLIDVEEYKSHKKKYNYSDEIDKILNFNVNEIKTLMKNRSFPFNDQIMNEYFANYSEMLKKKKNYDN